LRWIALSAAAARPAAFLLPFAGRVFLEDRRLRARTPEDRKLLDLLDPVAEAAGFEIVRLRLMGGSKTGRTLQVMAERALDGQMNVEGCTALSRALSEVLDAADPVSGDYRLEVSSPGIDRPLTRLKDFESYAGYEAKLELDRLVENRKRFRGTLAGIEGQDILIDLEGEEETTAQAPFAWIVDAKLILNDRLMSEGAAIRAARLESGEDPEQSENEEQA